MRFRRGSDGRMARGVGLRRMDLRRLPQCGRRQDFDRGKSSRCLTGRWRAGDFRATRSFIQPQNGGVLARHRKAEFLMLFAPGGGQIGQPCGAEAAREGSIDRGFDDVGGEESEGQDHARRARARVFSDRDGVDVGGLGRCDFRKPAPSFGDVADQPIARLGAERQGRAVAVLRLDDFAFAEESLRRPRDDGRGLIRDCVC